MRPRAFFLCLGLSSFITTAVASESEPRSNAGPKRSTEHGPNVLFISIDDLRPELGCYGAAHIHSPNIDRLASEGVLFERAYCQFALCNPSRTSLLTGMRPDHVGVVGNHVHFRSKHPAVVTLPQHFKNNGYHTLAIGKVYHGVFPRGASLQPADTMDDELSWSAPPFKPGPRYYYTPDGIAAAKKAYKRMYKVQHPAPDEWTTRLVFGSMTEAPDVDDGVLYDGQVADRAVETLRKIKDKPFFLAVGFIKPHTPFIAPKKYWDLYDPADIQLAESDSLPENAPAIAGHSSHEVRRYTDQPKKGPFSEENRRRLKHGYYACVSYIDAQVGRLLDELERLGLRDRTIVSLYGDHGWHLGDHGMWGKVTNFEVATRAPLIISVPGMPKGSRTQSLAEFVDIYPTLCDLIGLPLPDQLDGSSLAAVLKDPQESVRDAAFSQMTRGRVMGYSIRTDRYRYTQWIDTKSKEVRAEELYDHHSDPSEDRNVIDDPDHCDAVHLLRRELNRGVINAGEVDRNNTKSAMLTLARVFQDHMVLQRGIALPVWGRAPPGQAVTVEFGSASVSGKADDRGHWIVYLPPQTASDKPGKLTVRGRGTIAVHDVLVGEVWLCAGQSNMEWPLSKAACAKEALSAADRPSVRLLDLVGAARGGSGRYTPEHLARLTPKRFVSGSWQVCAQNAAKSFSAVAYFFGVKIQEELGVPVGLIDVAIGGTPTEAWISREALAAHPQLKLLVEGNWLENPHMGEWCRERAEYNFGRAIQDGETLPGDDLGPNHSFKPTFMWQSAVKPLVPFAVRGVIWYQGESNSLNLRRVQQHRELLPLLIGGWRRHWDRADLPFLFVQLPGMGTRRGYQSEHWPDFREGQRRTLQSVANTGMAVTIDIGHPTNVHPTTKQPVGERLALWAWSTIYGRTVTYSGPLCRDVKVHGREVRVQFDHVEKGLTTTDGEPPRHFEIAGEDGVFHPAHARIEGEAVIVESSNVATPRHVRYAWVPYPNPPVNLVNAAGLPASPFSTERR